MLNRLRRSWDAWAVTWWPARASTPALVARHRELAAELRSGDLGALADVGPVARELDRRGVAARGEAG